MNDFYREIFQQPQALREQVKFYNQPDLQRQLASLLAPTMPILTGMGASFHAALIAQLHLQTLKIPAHVIEAADLLNYSTPILSQNSQLVFVSQSGSSGEIDPIIKQLPHKAALLAISNDAQSLLARQAQIILPLVAGSESTVATKTYLNSLAVLWRLARQWGGLPPASEGDTLTAIADECDTLLAQADAILSHWLDVIGSSDHLLFLGHGPHAATAHQAAQTVTEWSKLPVQSNSIGAYRHGRIESAGSNLGVVIFTGSGSTHTSACQLAEELTGYGARVLLVENGQTRSLSETAKPNKTIDEFLTPMLDIIPAQLFAEGLTRHLGITPGFRHIAKVVTRL